VVLASAGGGAEGFHLGWGYGSIFGAGDGEDRDLNCGDSVERVGTGGEARLHGDERFRRQRHSGAEFGDDLRTLLACGGSDKALGHSIKKC